MSLSALADAIYDRLAGIEALADEALEAQQALNTLLGGDAPNRIWQGNRDNAVAFPALTYRPDGGFPDNRFASDVGGISNVRFSFEFWTDSPARNVLTDIADAVDWLLNERRGVADLLPLAKGRVWHMEAATDLVEGYDPERNAWYGLKQYLFVLGYC